MINFMGVNGRARLWSVSQNDGGGLMFQYFVDPDYPLPHGADSRSLYLTPLQLQHFISLLEEVVDTGKLPDDHDITFTLRRKEPKPYAGIGD